MHGYAIVADSVILRQMHFECTQLPRAVSLHSSLVRYNACSNNIDTLQYNYLSLGIVITSKGTLTLTEISIWNIHMHIHTSSLSFTSTPPRTSLLTSSTFPVLAAVSSSLNIAFLSAGVWVIVHAKTMDVIHKRIHDVTSENANTVLQ